MNEIYINSNLINTLDDLRALSSIYLKGGLKNLNISKIARKLGHDRKTIRKALKGNVPKTTRKRNKYVDSYRDRIIKLLQDDKRKFEYYQHIYNYMVREYSIECTYATLKNYIINDEELNKLFNKRNNTNSFTERFETEAGQQAQFDLKERMKLIDTNGNEMIVNVATLTLGFSRYNVRKIVLDTSYETVINFLAEAFEELEGVPSELVIDNIKCLVDKPRTKNKEALINPKFEEFAKNYGFKIKPCMPYRPQTKGKTETQNKVPSQLYNYNTEYIDICSVNDKLEIINKEDNEKISQATHLPPVFLLKREKEKLQKLPSQEIRKGYYIKLKEVIVSNESLVSYLNCKYSVPKEYIGKLVGRTIKNNKLLIYYNKKIITLHEISTKVLNIKDSHNLKYARNLSTQPEDNSIIIEEMENIKYDNY